MDVFSHTNSLLLVLCVVLFAFAGVQFAQLLLDFIRKIRARKTVMIPSVTHEKLRGITKPSQTKSSKSEKGEKKKRKRTTSKEESNPPKVINNQKTKSLISDETTHQIEKSFEALQAAPASQSLVKKHLSKDVFRALKYRKTKHGATLIDVIQSGVSNPDSQLGVYAPDAESYTVFQPLFDPIIHEYFKDPHHVRSQPAIEFGKKKIHLLQDLDTDGHFILSTRIRYARSLVGYPFHACMTKESYIKMEAEVRDVLGKMGIEELAGCYHPLEAMAEKVRLQAADNSLLFKEGDRFLQSANGCRFWPHGRGVYHSSQMTFIVWLNEKDHLRIISLQKGGNFGEVLDRLILGTERLQNQIPLARDDRLGWLTFSPADLGPATKASVHMRLPKMSSKPELKMVCANLMLQIDEASAGKSNSGDVVYEISSKGRLGMTEFDVVHQMYIGVQKLIELEKNS